MSKVTDIRRQTAEKLAKPPVGTQQKPIEGCVMPAHIRHHLQTIRTRCEQRVAEREAQEQEKPE